MKKILISLLLPLSMTAMAQVVEVNVSALSEEGSNERVGVVLKKDADTEAFYNLMVELKNHSDKVGATKNQADRKKSEAETGTVKDVLSDALA